MPIERPVEARFIFNGSAVAFAGRIRRPDDVFIKAAAGSHLPVTGGQAETRIQGHDSDDYRYKDFVKFSVAHTRAKGDFSDPKRAVAYTHGNHMENLEPANTHVQAHLEDLQIKAEADPEKQTPSREFFAKALDVEMTSVSTRGREPMSFRTLTAAFDGVTLQSGSSPAATLIVHTETNVFAECDTKRKLMERYERDGEFRDRYKHLFHPPGGSLHGILLDLLVKHGHAGIGPIVATFVTKLSWEGGKEPEGTEILNNRLTIHGLGRIYFGEIIIEEGYRRATLLRFELGSRIGGDASACEVVANGTHWPPTGAGGA